MTVKLKKCFVVSPIGKPRSPTRKRMDYLLDEVVQPVAEAVDRGVEVIRADRIHRGAAPILSEVAEFIATADIVVVILADENPNVYLELGLALSLLRPVVILRDSSEPVRADIAHLKCIVCSVGSMKRDKEMRERTSRFLQKAIF